MDATVKVAVSPAVTVRLAGCVVMDGATVVGTGVGVGVGVGVDDE